MICPNPHCCTSNLPDDAIFCPNCGQRLVLPLSVDFCDLTPSSIKYGEVCRLRWSGKGVKEIIFNEEHHSSVDEIFFMPSRSADYVAKFIGEDGSTKQFTFTIAVDVPSPKFYILYAPNGKVLPRYFEKGSNIDIYWETENVKRVELDGQEVPLDYHFITRCTSKDVKHRVRYFGLDESSYEQEFCVRPPYQACIDSFNILQTDAKERDTVTAVEDGIKYCKEWRLYHESDMNSPDAWHDYFSRHRPQLNFILKAGTYILNVVGEDDTILEKKFVLCKHPNATIEYSLTPVGGKDNCFTIGWTTKNATKVLCQGEEKELQGEFVFDASNKVAYHAYRYHLNFELIGANGNTIYSYCPLPISPKPELLICHILDKRENDFSFAWQTSGICSLEINGHRKSLVGTQRQKYVDGTELEFKLIDLHLNRFNKTITVDKDETFNGSVKPDHKLSFISWTLSNYRKRKYYLNFGYDTIYDIYDRLTAYEYRKDYPCRGFDGEIIRACGDSGVYNYIELSKSLHYNAHKIASRNRLGLKWDDTYENWACNLHFDEFLTVRQNLDAYYATDEDEKIIIVFGNEKNTIYLYERTHPDFDDIFEMYQTGVEPAFFSVEAIKREEIRKAAEAEAKRKAEEAEKESKRKAQEERVAKLEQEASNIWILLPLKEQNKSGYKAIIWSKVILFAPALAIFLFGCVGPFDINICTYGMACSVFLFIITAIVYGIVDIESKVNKENEHLRSIFISNYVERNLNSTNE